MGTEHFSFELVEEFDQSMAVTKQRVVILIVVQGKRLLNGCHKCVLLSCVVVCCCWSFLFFIVVYGQEKRNAHTQTAAGNDSRQSNSTVDGLGDQETKEVGAWTAHKDYSAANGFYAMAGRTAFHRQQILGKFCPKHKFIINGLAYAMSYDYSFVLSDNQLVVCSRLTHTRLVNCSIYIVPNYNC